MWYRIVKILSKEQFGASFFAISKILQSSFSVGYLNFAYDISTDSALLCFTLLSSFIFLAKSS